MDMTGKAAGYTTFDGAGRIGVIVSDTVDQDGQPQVRILSATVLRSVTGAPFLAFQSEYLDTTRTLGSVTIFQDNELPEYWQEALTQWRESLAGTPDLAVAA